MGLKDTLKCSATIVFDLGIVARRDVLLIVLIGACSGIIELALLLLLPSVLGKLVSSEPSSSQILSLFAVSTMQYVMIFFLLSFVNLILTWLTFRFCSLLTIGLNQEILKNSYIRYISSGNSINSGSESAKIFQHCEKLSRGIIHALINIYQRSIVIIALFCASILIDFRISLIVFAFIFFVGLTYYLCLHPILLTRGRLLAQLSTFRIAYFTNIFSATRDIIALNTPMYFIDFGKKNGTELTGVRSLVETLQVVPRVLGEVLVWIIVIGLVSWASSDRANIASTGAIIFALFRILPNVSVVMNSLSSISSSIGSLIELKDEIEMSRQFAAGQSFNILSGAGITRSTLAPDVRGRNVTFVYSGSRKNIFEEPLNFHIPPGSRCFLSGPSGSGKSTLIDLILGVRSPSSGEVCIGEKIYSSFQHIGQSYEIGLVSQRVPLLNGTLAENVRLGRNVYDNEVERSLEIAGLKSFMESHDGILTEIGYGSQRLMPSGGQLQRIGIARAILLKPAVLILDEAFIGIEMPLAKAIAQQIFTQLEHSTIILVSHVHFDNLTFDARIEL